MLKLETACQIALVSTPWPLFNRPSIQLGTLKAFVERELPQVPVHAYHPYLLVAQSVGFPYYRSISEKNWLAESVYGALLSPELFDTIEKFWWRRPSGKRYLPPGRDFHWLCSQVRDASERFLLDVEWDKYLLAGFSICFGQLTSTLYHIQRIKERAKELKIVIGGSSCAGKMGESLISTFKDIDFVIQGEGEQPLLSLVRYLSGDPSVQSTHSLPGILKRDDLGEPPPVSTPV